MNNSALRNINSLNFFYNMTLGFFFPFLCSLAGKGQAEKVYILDSIGDFLGGVFFTFFLVFFFNSFQSSILLALLNLFLSLYLSIRMKKRKFFPILAGLIITSFFLFFLDLNKLTIQMFYPNQKVVFQGESPYGNLVVTKTEDQLNFFENSILLFSTNTTVEKEETVHYALSQLENPKKVLLLSGGVSGTLEEILKYNVSRVDYVELDPLIIKLGVEFNTLPKDERIRVITTDARFFVKKKRGEIRCCDNRFARPLDGSTQQVLHPRILPGGQKNFEGKWCDFVKLNFFGELSQ